MTTTLQANVSCEPLGFKENISIKGHDVRMPFFKSMPMNASSIKKSLRVLEFSIKSIIEHLQKCNVWAKKHVKSLQEWLKAYIDFGSQTQKLNTPIKMKLFIYLFCLYCVFFPNILIVMMTPF